MVDRDVVQAKLAHMEFQSTRRRRRSLAGTIASRTVSHRATCSRPTPTRAAFSRATMFGRPIAELQAIQFMLADMATRLDAARLMLYRAATLKDAGHPCRTEASMAKLLSSEAAMWATTKAVQVHGGYGYMRDYPVERYMRDAKARGNWGGDE